MSNNNTSWITTQEGNYTPGPCDTVTIIQQGAHYYDVICMSSPVMGHVERIDANHYRLIGSDEIREYQHGDIDSDRNYANLHRTMTTLRRLIRTNFDGGDNQIFATLTYGTADRRRGKSAVCLQADWLACRQRILRAYPGWSIDYISVAEPQGDGTWHLHVLIRRNDGRLWIDQADMLRYWARGGVRVERLKGGDIGSYYVAYLTDVTPGASDGDDPVKLSKARVKGGRLSYYPKGMRFYRRSRGIRDPTTYTCTYGDMDDICPCTYSKSTDVYRCTELPDGSVETVRINRIYHATHRE